MHRVLIEREIGVSHAKAWEAIDQFGAISNFHPYVESSELLGDKSTGTGATRACHFDDGNTIQEAITHYVAERSYTVTITDLGNFPLKQAIADLRAEPAGDGRTRVSFDMRFKSKFGPVGWVMGKAMMEGQFRRILGEVIDGLETYVQTGQVVSRRSGLSGSAA